MPDETRILVCGGRDFDNAAGAYRTLDALVAELDGGKVVVCQGGASGADAIARQWCKERNIECTTYGANWHKHRKAAGPIRNAEMLSKFKPDMVIAFPGGDGTADMIAKAEKAGVIVAKIEVKERRKAVMS